MNIELREKDDERIVFLVEDVNIPFINAIRRICLVEIPKLAIETVNIYKNDAKMFDEVLAHRLGLLPIKTDLDLFTMPSECDCEDHCSNCSVSFLLKEKGPKIVYSKDIKSNDPSIKPVYDTIPLVELHENEEIELEAIAELGLGSEHAKWQAATTCSYKFYPKITIDNQACYNCGVCIDQCPRKILQFDDEKQVTITDIEKCSLCKTCERKCSGNAITIDYEESKYIFTLESDGSLDPVTILKKACDILAEKSDNVINFVMNEEE
ncbi:MAG: DNA-directed RNA polymerase subunit D [Methanobacteriaceae archaeon]|nr:DNA-directed RNA polymerase subunit D [Methanobacteriaceae archaeon]